MADNETDEFPPVHISLRNVTGDASEITLTSHMLGMATYALVTVSEDGFDVEGSHMDLEEFAILMAVVATSALLADGVDPELRASVIDMLQGAEVVDGD